MRPALAILPWQYPTCLQSARYTAPWLQRLRGGEKGRAAQKRLRSDVNDHQAIPLSGYYAEILSISPHHTAPPTTAAPEPSPPDNEPTEEHEQVLANPRVFGSRLAGPAQHAADKNASSTLIAGVLVPPRPTEPDNCCMSGCVNCVWDLFRDDMEEWAAKNSEAWAKLQGQRQDGDAKGRMAKEIGMPAHADTSVDDDGGGSEALRDDGDGGDGASTDLFSNIPVGIREFMKTEKMLKEKQARDREAGAG